MSSSPSRTSHEVEGIAFLEKEANRKRNSCNLKLHSNSSIILALLYVLLFTVVIGCYLKSLDPVASYRRTYGHSPLYGRIHLQPYQTTVNGTIWPSTDSGVARRFPNPIDEVTWDEWEIKNIIPITSAEIRRMGKDPATAAKLEDSIWSLGNDAYAGTLDLFHQIHCLNQLRKYAYRDYYDVKTANANPQNRTMHEIHTNHCVDILLQALQCSGNLRQYPFHKCLLALRPFAK
ncbi:hypothetical protein KVR01_012407 [Diaporthe batatas]|uniref:uncharacterized protein n=1 Tax=Diaporthe batatas TaxID=748121 RepID=UPI001D05040D|nr:uncharacterized protein KVR01_012407 [Diaporthe batatas]KAG8157745.1 hypothetical protein KVR01_012407 [Diaporthe batatas]